jgi:hypothetical protein
MLDVAPARVRRNYMRARGSPRGDLKVRQLIDEKISCLIAGYAIHVCGTMHPKSSFTKQRVAAALRYYGVSDTGLDCLRDLGYTASARRARHYQDSAAKAQGLQTRSTRLVMFM